MQSFLAVAEQAIKEPATTTYYVNLQADAVALSVDPAVQTVSTQTQTTAAW